MNKSTDVCWYPLRVTYSRELQLKEVLDAEHIENFIPMHYEYVKQGERKIRKLVPVVHNLVFVHSSFVCIDRIKRSLGSSLSVRYIVYLDPALTSLRKGDRVRIVGGVFEGVEGVVIRVKGDRRVSVCIKGIMAVATAYIHPSLIELIPDTICD